MVLVAEIHYEQNESFIKLGPLKRLEDKNDESVLVYDWHEKIVENHIERVVERYDKLKSEMPSIVKAIRQFMSARRPPGFE